MIRKMRPSRRLAMCCQRRSKAGIAEKRASEPTPTAVDTRPVPAGNGHSLNTVHKFSISSSPMQTCFREF